uniref:Uncharacterized protein n=1 Tax=Escherichia coli TaxID=562 RepID=Q93JV8_ECOLX|nr:unknown [Escherichia coli]FAA00065.1 TPA: hypothetical protein [Escherichia coli]
MGQTLTIEPSGESRGHCDCCGNSSRTVWGYVQDSERTICAYFVQWTVGAPDHFPNFDFLIGTWGDDAVSDKVLSSWLFNPEAGSFMIIDASSRPAAASDMCNHALSRAEVLAAPGMKSLASQCLDAVWIQDERVAEIRGWKNDA